MDKGKGRDKTCILDSDEDDIFLDFEYGEDETDISLIDSREKGKNQTISISDDDEDENQEDYTKFSWFWEDGQRLTDSWYGIENVEDLTSTIATSTAATTCNTNCTTATNVDSYDNMFDMENDTLMVNIDNDDDDDLISMVQYDY